ncbi:hypothetical protein [Streptomyces griseoaurantiacus]|uniref:Uncharacterized protein n=1 Tax=Streptomyces griseoaurantiacus TaxID=68213 RepID=A0A1G7XRP5_9ACTN|nr:hypothetical protein [Streptomyces jietaisiensis]SDG86776.1 hypothetical protein SAMN05216260_13348 [Streptomyces jietaisiensis]
MNYSKELIPLFLVSHVHHAGRQAAEHFTILLDSLTLPGLDVRLISADAHQGRGSARWLDVELYATKGHGYPNADTTDALDAVVLALDVITGHEVKGFGSVCGGALAGSHAIREGLALSLRLDVEADAQSLPDSHFRLDDREPRPVEEVAA